jgi:hypothetical protein
MIKIILRIYCFSLKWLSIHSNLFFPNKISILNQFEKRKHFIHQNDSTIIYIIDLLGLVHYERTKYDLIHCSLFLVWANLGEASVCPPYTDGARTIACHHSWSVRAESNDCEGGFVHNLIFSGISLILVPQSDTS